jgi:Domain of unknown function (DUF4174)
MSQFQEVAKMKMLSLPLLTAASIAFAPAEGRTGSGVFRDKPVEAGDLAQYRSSYRLVLLFAPSDQDPAYIEQRAALEATLDGLVERDILVVIDTDPNGHGSLRTSFDAEGFEVLLIGKDGGVKLRQREPIGTDTLFALIDAMPMRRQEMRR